MSRETRIEFAVRILSKADEPLRNLTLELGAKSRESLVDFLGDHDLVHVLRSQSLCPAHDYYVMSRASGRLQRHVAAFLKRSQVREFDPFVPMLSEWTFRHLSDFSVVHDGASDQFHLRNYHGERSQPFERSYLRVASIVTLRTRVMRLGNFHWVGKDSDLVNFFLHWGI